MCIEDSAAEVSALRMRYITVFGSCGEWGQRTHTGEDPGGLSVGLGWGFNDHIVPRLLSAYLCKSDQNASRTTSGCGQTHRIANVQDSDLGLSGPDG